MKAINYIRHLVFFIFLVSSQYLIAQLPEGYSATEVQNGYNTIMGVVFNNDGTKMFVWEKRGHIYVSNWDGSNYIKQSTPVLDISDEVGDWRDFGFASICLDPDFDSNGLIYMYYMVDREHLMDFGTSDYDPNDNDYYEASISRVTRYQLNVGSSPLTTNYASRTVLLGESVSTGVPLLHESHAGGTILFADDGTLLVSTGDNASYTSVDTGSANETYYQQAINDGILRPEENVGAFRSQMITSLCGKVLRLDPDTGDGVPSNPFYESANPRSPQSRIWSLGLRHPFRMSIQKGSGSTNPADGNPGIIHIADVGWGTWEDLHIFDKGGLNGGWPLYEGLTQHNGYYNSGTTNPDEGNVPFVNNCPQPTSFNDDPDPSLRRFVHDRPEVAWRHGNSNNARVPWFDSSGNPTNPRVGSSSSPTTGIEFRGNTAIAGVYIQGDALGSSMTGKYLFTDYVRNWINIATFTDGTQNWISDISELAPLNFGDGIVHMMQNPLDGNVYYVNIFNGTLFMISFDGPTWVNQPLDVEIQCSSSQDINLEFNNWLNSYSGTVGCGNPTITNNANGISVSCGNTASETVVFTLSDECGNLVEQQATFSVVDSVAPSFVEILPTDQTISCDNIPEALVLTATDNCGNAQVDYLQTIIPGACDGNYNIVRSWLAEDDCNNTTLHEQVITVQDQTDPIWTISPTDLIVSCSEDYQTAYQNWLQSFSGTDNCGAAVVNNDAPVSIDCPDIVNVNFELTDLCGNSSLASATFTVEETLSSHNYKIDNIRIYPNPAQHTLNIQGLDKSAKVMIYNMLGKKVLEKQVKNQLTLQLNSGLYVIQIETELGRISKKLIIDQSL